MHHLLYVHIQVPFTTLEGAGYHNICRLPRSEAVQRALHAAVTELQHVEVISPVKVGAFGEFLLKFDINGTG